MDQYCKVMEEHLSKGYIEELSDIKQPWPEQGCHYLPDFFVLKDSETTPLRIVFAANSGKVSLNDCLYTGPCLLNNLVELLLRFRFPQYAFVADIQQAFLHIKLREEDRPFVRFLWYKDNDPNKQICVYTYTTIVFGHTSSPMSLGAVLLHHLEKYSSQLLSTFPKNSTWTISFPVLKTSLKRFLIFTKLVPLCLKAISFYINGAQILPRFKRKSKIIIPVHSLPLFPFWDFLGTPKRTRFRSPYKLSNQRTRNLLSAKFLAWQVNYTSLSACCRSFVYC